MKIIGVIPARYASSRFPGKPLADICGKPMIWWVYQQARKSKKLDQVYVATDDERIENVCRQYNIPVLMTSASHETPADRMYEVSTRINADLYVSINGDEPLISVESIEAAVPSEEWYHDEFVGGVYTEITDAADLIDVTNIKVVTNDKEECVYVSRTPVPYPKGVEDYAYKKYIGVVSFAPKALKFYVSTQRGSLEKMEEIDLFRFIEHRKVIHFKKVSTSSISVDTYKDLKKVIAIIQKQEADK